MHVCVSCVCVCLCMFSINARVVQMQVLNASTRSSWQQLQSLGDCWLRAGCHLREGTLAQVQLELSVRWLRKHKTKISAVAATHLACVLPVVQGHFSERCCNVVVSLILNPCCQLFEDMSWMDLATRSSVHGERPRRLSSSHGNANICLGRGLCPDIRRGLSLYIEVELYMKGKSCVFGFCFVEWYLKM